MLATITNTNIDIVRSAIKVFTQLNMMEIMDDGTYFMSEVQKMIGSETEWAKKQREYRANKRQQEDIVLSLSDKSKSKSKSIDKDIDKKKKELSKDNSLKEKGKFIPPTIEEVEVYCNERGNGVDAEKFVDFYTSKGWMVGSNKMKDWKAAVRTWERKEKSKGGALNGKPNNTTKQYTEEQLDRFAELL